MNVKVKTEAQERKESFVHMIFWAMCCVYLAHCLMGCSGSVGCFYKPINGLEEKQTYSDKAK